MDGKLLLRTLRELLGESSNSDWLDDFTSYGFLNAAAQEFVQRTECLRSEQSITTVAETASYDLNADFLQLYLRDSSNNWYLKIAYSTTTNWIKWKPYEELFTSTATSIPYPSNFAIIDNPTLPTLLTGTASATGAASGGQCTLTNSPSGGFVAGKVSPGDSVNNTTDGATGIVLSVTSATALVTALFDGSGNDWTSSDAYAIQPQARLKIVLDPPPSVSGYTITVPYVQRPNPVYSNYGTWRIPEGAHLPICQYAAFLYKYRDREAQFGDAFNVMFERAVQKWARRTNENIKAKDTLKVNFMGRR